MRILLDESLPKDLGPLVAGHEAVTVSPAGWSGVKNGKLLTLAASSFDVFLTADRSLEFQQNLGALPEVVVVLLARSNRIEHLKPLLPWVAEGTEPHFAADAVQGWRLMPGE